MHMSLCVPHIEGSSEGNYMIQEDIVGTKLRCFVVVFFFPEWSIQILWKEIKYKPNVYYHLYLSGEQKLNGFSMKPRQDKVFKLKVVLSVLYSAPRSVPLSHAKYR